MKRDKWATMQPPSHPFIPSNEIDALRQHLIEDEQMRFVAALGGGIVLDDEDMAEIVAEAEDTTLDFVRSYERMVLEEDDLT